MIGILRTAVVCVLALSGLQAVRGQDATDPPKPTDPPIRFPAGGGFSYFWAEGKNGPEVVGISYGGGLSDWLTSQQHPRSHWHKIPTLELIEFQGELTVRDMEFIASLKSVQRLDLTRDGNIYQKGSLAPLAKMTWLKSLKIELWSHLSRLESTTHDLTNYEHPSGEFFRFLDKTTELEELDIWPICDEATWIRICNLKKLKGLHLGEFDRMSAENARRIANLQQLEYVSLRTLEDATPFLQGLRNHQHLKSLHFDTRDLTTANVAALSTITNLERLSITGQGERVPEPGKRIGSLSSLRSLTKLKYLFLRFDAAGPSDQCRFLASMPDLEECLLDLRGIGTNDFALEHLRNCKQLKTLVVRDAVLSDADLDILESLPKLTAIAVANSERTDWYQAAKRRLPMVKIHGRTE